MKWHPMIMRLALLTHSKGHAAQSCVIHTVSLYTCLWPHFNQVSFTLRHCIHVSGLTSIKYHSHCVIVYMSLASLQSSIIHIVSLYTCLWPHFNQVSFTVSLLQLYTCLWPHFNQVSFNVSLYTGLSLFGLSSIKYVSSTFRIHVYDTKHFLIKIYVHGY